MSKRIKHLLIAATALCIVAAVGLTLAFMFKKAEKTNRFIPAEVSCAVREKLDNNEVAGTAAVGGEKADIRVENTGGWFRIMSIQTATLQGRLLLNIRT